MYQVGLDGFDIEKRMVAMHVHPETNVLKLKMMDSLTHHFILYGRIFLQDKLRAPAKTHWDITEIKQANRHCLDNKHLVGNLILSPFPPKDEFLLRTQEFPWR
ncbi:hypothetical protein ATG66_2287 [Vibrio sp. ES.051]|uniref:hypothetical protein n=1 Tax=Vibrio sp. ES.051 TaxID=1761909 RepID=UPI000BF39DB5|nr:hypothetical protein [Vibrio sp. ES.051]PFG55965.1 hypothetical protein ATG66_2287 [Vibrio sp. ES.051]